MATVEAWLRDYKKTLHCVTCGFADFRALTFHHEHREEKRFNIADMVVRGHGVASLQQEIAKCIVLCANCHRIEHAGEQARDLQFQIGSLSGE
jgi:5-methylcytosine-specific restriction endonuclease McrA